LALSVGACASTDATAPAALSAGNWKIERSVDRISGAPAARVFLSTTAGNSRSRRAAPAIVQLMCYEERPIVRFAFDFRVGINKTAFLEYRFDAIAGRKANADILPDHKTILIAADWAEVSQFVDALAASSILFVRVSSLSDGRTEAEFRTGGAPGAIETAYAACPLPRSTAGR
jgi:hypothetical protein